MGWQSARVSASVIRGTVLTSPDIPRWCAVAIELTAFFWSSASSRASACSHSGRSFSEKTIVRSGKLNTGSRYMTLSMPGLSGHAGGLKVRRITGTSRTQSRPVHPISGLTCDGGVSRQETRHRSSVAVVGVLPVIPVCFSSWRIIVPM